MNGCIQVLTTTDTKQAAEEIARVLVESRLAACVQIIGPITSIYRWKGKVEQAKEHLCIIKTRAALFRKVEAEIKRLHSYEVPEIIALPISKGSRRYLAWLASATSAAPPSRAGRSRRR
jgi:periplasmic divalent cation tolerance protein